MSVVPRDCFVSARGLVSFEVARLTALALVRAQARSEVVPLAEARGRVLAAPVVAPRSLPAFDQAAMDGYAIALGDRSKGRPRPATRRPCWRPAPRTASPPARPCRVAPIPWSCRRR